jgi:hypothetical protein
MMDVAAGGSIKASAGSLLESLDLGACRGELLLHVSSR